MHKHALRFEAVALVGTVLLFVPFKGYSDVISGTGILTWGEWDFSESALYVVK
jgi:hypothetical protein